MRPRFPFSAIVGQEEMKRALLIAVIDPSIGGVLIFGERGTAKSTAVRALAGLLPSMPVVAGCRFRCDPRSGAPRCTECQSRESAGERLRAARARVPVAELPLGATEDRVVGALDLERALARGEKAFEPGLLASAHRGFLYIDEVNLLEDHLVDLLLDVAATGENVVEREGLSLTHPAQFVLVGSGNPEEGELRPQLLDRFGLSVEVRTPDDLATRVTVVRRRDAFDRDPEAFTESYRAADERLRRTVQRARARLPHVSVSDAMVELSVRLAAHAGADGVRGELTVVRAMRAVAALEGASAASVEHLRLVAPAALRHRLRRDPLDETGSQARIERAVDEVLSAVR